MMPHLGGWDPEVRRAFSDLTLDLWVPQMGLVDLYCYAGMDYCVDLEMRAPMGRPWGFVGMLLFFCCLFISNYVFEI